MTNHKNSKRQDIACDGVGEIMGYGLGMMETAEVKERHGSFPAWSRGGVTVKNEKVHL